MKLLLFILFLYSDFFFPYLSSGEIVDRIAAMVNEDIILLSDLRIRIAQMKGIYALEEMDNNKRVDLEKATLNLMIEEKMLVQYAYKTGIEVEDEEIEKSINNLRKENNLTESQLDEALRREGISRDEYKKVLKEQRMISIVLNQEVGSKIHVTESEIRDYYNRHLDIFMTEEEVKINHILSISNLNDPEEKRDKARHKAEDLLNRIKAGENFEKLAILYSKDSTSDSGGDLGFFRRGDMIKAFEDVAFSLNPGDISGVVETKFGYHILKCKEKRESVPMEYSEASKVINQRLFSEKIEKRRELFLERLKKDLIIERRML